MEIYKQRYLITGGAGFIGSHIAEHLSQNNAFVIVLDNLVTGNIKNIQHLQNILFVKGDINDSELLKDLLPQIDVIIHLAALGSVNRSIERPMDTHLANSTGFLNILYWAKEYNMKGVIYASSSSVYGDDSHLPKKEEYIGNPLSPYAVSKLSNELYAKVFWQLFQLPVIGLRYFNVFGPRQNPYGPYAAAIPIFIEKMLNQESIYIHGSGEQKRDFTYVENVVNANLAAIQSILNNNTKAFGGVFNIGCHQSISINQVFEILAKKLNYIHAPVYTEPRKGDIFASLADISKAQEILGYKPTVFFEEGIERTVRYFMSNIT